MKDNHHITQNQTVKININNSGNKPSKRRNKPRPVLGGFGGGGGGGGGFNPTGVFGAPNILHNDNKPDVSNLENTLQKVYDNQMTQHTYSNYIRDGYAHYPRIEASHPMFMIDDKEHMPRFETRIEELPDEKEEEEEEEPEFFHLAGDESPISPMGSLASAKSYIPPPPPEPHTPFKPTLKLKGRHRKEANNMGKKGVKTRIQREVAALNGIPEKDRKTRVDNIKTDINHIHETYKEDYKHLLPAKYH